MIKILRYLACFIFALHTVVAIGAESFDVSEVPYKMRFEKSPKSKKLVIIFSSCFTDGPEFAGTIGRLRESSEEDFSPNALFISHPESWYIPERSALTEILRQHILPFGEQNTYLLGSSMGGWGALLYGSFFPDAHVLVFSPQTCIASEIPAWMRYEADHQNDIFDLTELVSKRVNRGKTTIIASENEPFDLAHALYLKKIDGIKIKVISSQEKESFDAEIRDFHNIAGILAAKRTLTPIVQDFLLTEMPENMETELFRLESCPSPLESAAQHIFMRIQSGSKLGVGGLGLMRRDSETSTHSTLEDFSDTLELRESLSRNFQSEIFSELLTVCEKLAEGNKILHIYEHIAEILGEQVQALLAHKGEDISESFERTKRLITQMLAELRKSKFDSLADQLEEETAVLFTKL